MQLCNQFTLGIITAINCVNVTWATRFQNVFTSAKLVGIALLVGTGVTRLAQGRESYIITALSHFEVGLKNLLTRPPQKPVRPPL